MFVFINGSKKKQRYQQSLIKDTKHVPKEERKKVHSIKLISLRSPKEIPEHHLLHFTSSPVVYRLFVSQSIASDELNNIQNNSDKQQHNCYKTLKREFETKLTQLK
jgi:hypothetical protein